MNVTNIHEASARSFTVVDGEKTYWVYEPMGRGPQWKTEGWQACNVSHKAARWLTPGPTLTALARVCIAAKDRQP